MQLLQNGYCYRGTSDAHHYRSRAITISLLILAILADVFDNVDNKNILILLNIHIFIINCSICFS